MSARRKSTSDSTGQNAGRLAREYDDFIGQIELESIWLATAEIRNDFGATPPDQLFDVVIDMKGHYFKVEGGFNAFASYELAFLAEDQPSSQIDVRFGLFFSSQTPMTDELFEVFQEVNLPLNTWPYLREFVQSMAARMDWPRLTLPTFKAAPAGGGGRRRRGKGQAVTEAKPDD